MSCVKEFRNNSELSKQAKTFGQFLDYRSNFDKGYLQKYDTLALQAPTGPNPTITEHYRVNEGPYGAWNKNKCSANNNRECWGGGPVLGSQRENYGTATGKQLITRLTFPNPLWGTYKAGAKVKQALACDDGVSGHAAPGVTCPATGTVKATVTNSSTVDVVTTKGTFRGEPYSPEMCPPTTVHAPYPCPVTIGGVQIGMQLDTAGPAPTPTPTPI